MLEGFLEIFLIKVGLLNECLDTSGKFVDDICGLVSDLSKGEIGSRGAFTVGAGLLFVVFLNLGLLFIFWFFTIVLLFFFLILIFIILIVIGEFIWLFFLTLSIEVGSGGLFVISFFFLIFFFIFVLLFVIALLGFVFNLCSELSFLSEFSSKIGS